MSDTRPNREGFSSSANESRDGSERPMPEHCIAVCNYNMADTVERSLRSMLDQTDETFEVVVVDGGSSDESVDILRSLASEYDRLRVVELESDSDRHLGADRNTSFEAADAPHVLESLDTDDLYYDGVISDFVDIYHQLRDQLEFDFVLSGTGLNVGPRDLLLEVPYRNLGGSEDRDWWRRLFARDALIWLDHNPPCEEIGYDMDLLAQIRRDVHGKVTDFQVGIGFWSCVRYTLWHEHYYILEKERGRPVELLKRLYDLASYPYAWARARSLPEYDTPPEFREKGAIERRIAEERCRVSELERRFDVEIDTSGFSDVGRSVFLDES